MHIPVIAALRTAKSPRLCVGAADERGASVAAARTCRLSSDASHSHFHVRRLTPADAHHMAGLLERMSPQSRYLRYFRLVRSLAPADIARFVAISPDHLAMGAFDEDVLVGAAQYFRSSERPDHAEVAVEVADSHHRRRVGARLVRELARRASDAGITHFTATVLSDNRPMLGLMRHSGWEIATVVDGAYAEVLVTLPPRLAGEEEQLRGREPKRLTARHALAR